MAVDSSVLAEEPPTRGPDEVCLLPYLLEHHTFIQLKGTLAKDKGRFSDVLSLD